MTIYSFPYKIIIAMYYSNATLHPSSQNLYITIRSLENFRYPLHYRPTTSLYFNRAPRFYDRAHLYAGY